MLRKKINPDDLNCGHWTGSGYCCAPVTYALITKTRTLGACGDMRHLLGAAGQLSDAVYEVRAVAERDAFDPIRPEGLGGSTGTFSRPF